MSVTRARTGLEGLAARLRTDLSAYTAASAVSSARTMCS